MRRGHGGGTSRTLRALWIGMAATLLAACGQDVVYEYPRKQPGTNKPTYKQTQDSVLGPDGLTLFDTGAPRRNDGSGSGIAVNAYLWRASLDTVSFMPLASADPFGGVIITDWYTPPEAEGERYKINIYILDQTLRSDGVRASVFRQRLAGAGQWVDSPIDAKLGTELEDAILTRARQLRLGGRADNK